MVTKRIIPCLDVRNGRVVKGVNFLDVQDVSDPVRLADYYSRSGADELVFYDITASVEGRKLFTDILTDVASTIFIPLTVGGGISRLEDFERVLATCRSREISINIVIQNMAQLKKLFKDSWENVTGNCDTLLYLGGNEASTHEYISKMLGKATIDTRTRGVTKGRSGSSSTNYQNAGRELLMPDEVRMLDNRKALIFIRGERPVMDEKYPIQKHPNYRFSADGGQPPYEKRFDIPCYEQNDLPHEIDIENLEILEETQNEEENHSEPGRKDAQGKAPLLHRCTDLCSRLRHLYARFRRR